MCKGNCGIGEIIARVVDTVAQGIRALAGTMANQMERGCCGGKGGCGTGACGGEGGCGTGACNGVDARSNDHSGCCGGCMGQGDVSGAGMPAPAETVVPSAIEAAATFEATPSETHASTPLPAIAADVIAAPMPSAEDAADEASGQIPVASGRLGALRAIPEADITTKLTPRQSEIILLEREGLSNNEIADRLGLNKGTVSNHRKKARAILGVSDEE